MRKIILLCIFALPISFTCFAQSDQSETLTITTYYPSPYGVYKTLRLNPSQQPAVGSSAAQPGTMYFDKGDQRLYIYNGSGPGQWELIGSSGGASGSALIVESGHKVWPDTCLGDLQTRLINGGTSGTGSLCSVAWLKKITFTKTFSKAPQVFVTAEILSGSLDNNVDDYYTCGEHSTDSLKAYPENVTDKGFDLRIASSANQGSSCCNAMDCTDPSDQAIMGYYGKGEAGWVAIGD